jgi:hypothetical protein
MYAEKGAIKAAMMEVVFRMIVPRMFIVVIRGFGSDVSVLLRGVVVDLGFVEGMAGLRRGVVRVLLVEARALGVTGTVLERYVDRLRGVVSLGFWDGSPFI